MFFSGARFFSFLELVLALRVRQKGLRVKMRGGLEGRNSLGRRNLGIGGIVRESIGNESVEIVSFNLGIRIVGIFMRLNTCLPTEPFSCCIREFHSTQWRQAGLIDVRFLTARRVSRSVFFDAR